MPRKNVNDGELDFKEVIKYAAISAGIAIAVVFGLIALFAILMTKVDLPSIALTVISIFLTAFAGFVGGYLSSRMYQRKGIVMGVVSGILICLVILFVALCAYGDFQASVFSKLPVVLAASTIGGVFGVNRKRKYR